ncbi:hypothetical protein [Trebonia sp.]|uniref:hypothetical protein n=1 Tax=Trebonia sp. TaxID=2767075 RepID=UPI002637A549|nr:hypothetical protein [Trebonia sp.]
MSAAQYRIISPAGEERESGNGDAAVADGALTLTPAAGAVLRVPFAHIASVSEPEPFTVRVTLADGNAIELSRLGTMRTQLLAELRDGRGDDAAAAAAAVGNAATFSGWAGAEPAEIRVYEDALIVVAGSAAERVSFSFIESAGAQDYTVTVAVAGRAPVVLSRLGRRTGELVALLTDRLHEARGRTAAFLGALLPGLDPMALRSAAGLLRDGVAVPARALDAIHPELSGTLLRVATLPDRGAAVAELASRTDVALGFKQLASVRRPAAGGTRWHDPAVAPHIGSHDSPGGLFQPGLAGAMAAEVAEGMGPGGGYGPGGFGPGGFGGGYGPGGYGGGYGGPFGELGGGYGVYGGLWALRALGAGMNSGAFGGSGGSRPMTARAGVTHGLLTPETEDLSALTVRGEDPTVLAFALCCRPPGAPGGGRVAYEVLNVAEPMTFVYRTGGDDSDGGDRRAAINRALDDAGFDAAAVHAAGLTAAARPDARASLLARSLAGTAAHDADWPRRIAELLGG